MKKERKKERKIEERKVERKVEHRIELRICIQNGVSIELVKKKKNCFLFFVSTLL